MEKRFDVIALGELLIDFSETGESAGGSPLFEANPGGAPCNVLAMLRRLDRSCAFIGKVGDELFGRMLRRTVGGLGIDVSGLRTDGGARTALAIVKNAPDGEREFVFYRDPGADELLCAEELPEAILRGARIFHFGSLSMTHPVSREATKRAAALAGESGALISFDPNLRPALWKSPDEARRQIEWGLSRCDILKISDDEAAFLTGEPDPAKSGALLHRRYPGVRMLNVTAGAEGSFSFPRNGDPVFVPAFRLSGTVDTTGAGDTFCACVLHYILEYGTDPDRARREEMLRFAGAAAALVTARRGALLSMPTRGEIDALLRG